MTQTPCTCSVCVLDTSIPSIIFDEAGQCNCCSDAFRRLPFEWFPNAEGQVRLDKLVARLKEEGRGKPYDAMIGLSGGIDSAYLAHLAASKYKLRLLAIHVDGGWNSEAAVRNIESLVRSLNLDLHTHVVEWSEMRDLQLAFLKASVINQDIPQDHAFFSTLYRTARQFGIRHFLSGVNFSSESITPPGFGYPSMDGRHSAAIHKRFGTIPLRHYRFMYLPEFFWLTRILKTVEVHRPLNFIDYNKEKAKSELTDLYGWREYGEKHGESRFTGFYQTIFLPRKFGFDKRRLHLSSLIVSQQMTRTDAMRALEQPIISPEQERRDIKYIAKKLGLSPQQLMAYVESPPVAHTDYPNDMVLHHLFSSWKRMLRGLSTRDAQPATSS